ncbi:unnamed protein product [Prorocentrum cordatum]|uniref:Uncharacterized protein n=1 Tax=Prorocentrum cordatum TaxID=2364126 RepID=A0ABN9WD83_9DINO|nr:unnamed protein product [Polarella glacialis]
MLALPVSENQAQRVYRLSKGGKKRKFKLRLMGSTTEAVRCELCKRTSNSEDPLRPGYERERAYYKANGEPEGAVCFYSSVAHRTRFKAWTRDELSKDVDGNEEKQEEFLMIEQAVIAQKRNGNIELDMASLPAPILIVKLTVKSEISFLKPKTRLVTEEAFKNRESNPKKLSFKDAGMLKLVGNYEVEPGVWKRGFMELIGEEGTYEIESKFTKGTQKEHLLDDGRPAIDEGQIAANFHQAAKKGSNAAGSSTMAANKVNDMIQAAMARMAKPEDSGEVDVKMEGNEAQDDDEAMGEDEDEEMAQEVAAEAALGFFGSERPAKQFGKSAKKLKRTAEEDVKEASGSSKKKAKSEAILVATREKGEKEMKEVCIKFYKGQWNPGPLANKKKATQKSLAKVQTDVEGRVDEAAVRALGAWTVLVDVIDRILGLLHSMAAVKAVLGSTGKLRGSMDKQAISDFISEMVQARQIRELLDHMPSSFHELDFKMSAWRAIEERSFGAAVKIVSLAHIRSVAGSQTAPDILSGMQRSVMGKLVQECAGCRDSKEAEESIRGLVTTLNEAACSADHEDSFMLPDLLRDIRIIKTLLDASNGQGSEQLDATIASAKASSSGALFHFRVSPLGTKALTALAKASQQKRSTEVFERRWTQALHDMHQLASLRWAPISIDDSAAAAAEQFRRVADDRSFLQTAPATFWTQEKGEDIAGYEVAITNELLPAFGCSSMTMGLGPISELITMYEDLPEDEAMIPASFSEQLNALKESCKAVLAVLEPQAIGKLKEPITGMSKALNCMIGILDFAGFKAALSNIEISECIAFAKERASLCNEAGDNLDLGGGIRDRLHLPRAASGPEAAVLGQWARVLDDIQGELSGRANNALQEASTNFAHSLLHFAPEFKTLCTVVKGEAATFKVEEIFCPIDFEFGNLQGIFNLDGVVALVQELSPHTRAENREAELRSALRVWTDGHQLREVQLAARYSDAHVTFFRASDTFRSTAVQSCPAAMRHEAAFSTPKKPPQKATGSSGSSQSAEGEKSIVNASLVNLIVEIHKEAQKLPDLGAVELKAFFEGDDHKAPLLNGEAKTKATASILGLTSSLAWRWTAALDAGNVSMKDLMPKGDWQGKAVDGIDETYCKDSLLKNPNHIRMAQLCEWLEGNLRDIKDAFTKMPELSEESDTESKKAMDAAEKHISSVKFVVASAVVLQVLFVGNGATATKKDDRQKIKTELESTLQKSKIEMSTGLNNYLVEWATSDAAPILDH